jgi:carbamate kinase
VRIVIKVSGRALVHPGERPDAATLRWHIRRVANAVAPIVADHDVVLCFGNSVEVATMALESESDPTLTRPFPLDALGAQSQGLIGYWLAQELQCAGAGRPVIALVTQTVVGRNGRVPNGGRAFVGPPYTPDQVQLWAAHLGWEFGLDQGHWRRVVPRYEALAIVELPAVEVLLASGACVVCCGGGGIPVERTEAGCRPLEAVVDVALTASRLAVDLEADRLLFLIDDAADGRQLETTTLEHSVAAGQRFTYLTGRAAAVGSLGSAVRLATGQTG